MTTTTQNKDISIRQILSQPRNLPEDPKKERIVLWKIFRNENDALEYSHHILLEEDQRIVGGYSSDSAGDFLWLGVEVEDIEAWGNTQAIQLADPFEATDPKGQGQGFTH